MNFKVSSENIPPGTSKNRRERSECEAQEPQCTLGYTRIPNTRGARSNRITQQVFRGAPPFKHTYVMTLIGHDLDASVLKTTFALVQIDRFRLMEIRTLSSKIPPAIEVVLTSRRAISIARLRKDCLPIQAKRGIDIAIQNGPSRYRGKRLFVTDMDSTLISMEVIDELGREAGVMNHVAAITEQAMRGELSFPEALRARVRLLKNLPVSVLEKVYRRIRYTPGATALISILKRLGYRTAVLTGGFDYFTSRVQGELGLDYFRANKLEVRKGLLTGRVLGKIVDGVEKASFMEAIANKEGIPLEQVVAVGDGANDLPMILKAGMGIAFNAKPAVHQVAPYHITQKRLDVILYLLGFSDHQISMIE